MSVRLYKQENHFGIETDAATEESFISEFSKAQARLIESGEYKGEWEAHLNKWLPQFADIVCKLRGYKSNVTERRVIAAGEIAPGVSLPVAVEVDAMGKTRLHREILEDDLAAATVRVSDGRR